MLDIVKKSSLDFWNQQDIKGIERIVQLLNKKEPFSYIRIGEGETTFLSEERDTAELRKRYKYYFGCKPYRYKCLVYNMRKAVQEADLVTLLVRPTSISLQESSLLRRWNKVLTCTEFLTDKNKIHYGFRTNYFLHLTGVIFEWIQEYATYIISCHCQVKNNLSLLFNKEINFIQLPKRAVDGNCIDTQHWTLHFKSVLSRINKIPAKSLVLIGGGPLGKIYANWVKRSGSFAVDCGALFDAWIGYFTRPFHLLYSDSETVREGGFSSGNRVHSDLILTAENIRKFTGLKVRVQDCLISLCEERVTSGIPIINAMNGTY